MLKYANLVLDREVEEKKQRIEEINREWGKKSWRKNVINTVANK